MRALQTKRTLCTMALGCALAVTAAAPAQFGLSGGIGEAFRPSFTSRDVQLAVEMLQLDDAQKFILETLYDDYDAEFITGVDGFRQNVTDLRTKIDPVNPDPGQIMRVVFGTINVWRVEARHLADQLMEDLQGILNDEQLEYWGTFQRKLFRLKYIKNGQLPGEKLDLLNDVRDLDLDSDQTLLLQPLLDQYEQQLDDALRRREDYMQTSQTALIEAIQEENYNVGIEVATRQVALRKGVRDVNEQYTITIADALPDETGKAFLESIRQMTYPRVYRRTPAGRAFDAALELPDLDSATLEAINEIRLAYIAETDVFNTHLVQMIRDYKPLQIKYKVEQAAARLGGGKTDRLTDPTREQFTKRAEMSRRYIDQLKSLLTAEQFASLPGARRWIEPDKAAIAAARERVQRAKSAKNYKQKTPGGRTLPAPGSGISNTEGNTGNTGTGKTADD